MSSTPKKRCSQRFELAEKIAAGELIDLEVRLGGVAALSGLFRDDPVLNDICNEIYTQRDAERPE